MSQPRQPTLDVVRGIAILLVLLFHLRVATGIAGIDAMLVPLLDAGWAGVDLFFVLSGFLVGRLILTEAATAAGFDQRRFLWRRVLRLWPVLFLYLATLILLGGRDGWALAWPVVLHVQNYADHVPSHFWSLAVEEQFYLIAAAALPLILSRYGPRRLAVVLIGVMAVSLSLRLGGWAIGMDPRSLQWQTQFRADGVAAGVLLAWAELYRPGLLDALLQRRRLNAAIAVAGLAVLMTMTSNRLRFGPGIVAADIASVALTLACYRATIPARLGGLARALIALGSIAYPLYIWHASIAHVADVAATALGIDAPLIVTAWRYGCAIAVAAVIAALVERPLMRLRDVSHRPPATRSRNRLDREHAR